MRGRVLGGGGAWKAVEGGAGVLAMARVAETPAEDALAAGGGCDTRRGQAPRGGTAAGGTVRTSIAFRSCARDGGTWEEQSAGSRAGQYRERLRLASGEAGQEGQGQGGAPLHELLAVQRLSGILRNCFRTRG